MPATRYLKNAWARKDADGSYWLFIQGGDQQAMWLPACFHDVTCDPRRQLSPKVIFPPDLITS